MTPEPLELSPAAEFPLGELAALINRAFDGYVGGTFTLSAQSLATFLTTHGVKLELSQVARRGGVPLGLALISRRGAVSRLTLMGIVPEAKGQGNGTLVMNWLIDAAKARGDTRFDLEVVQQNPAGIRLYEACGFKRVQALLEFSLEQPVGVADTRLVAVDIGEAARHFIAHEDDNTPWQAGGFNLITLGPPNQAFKLGAAYAVISDTARDTLILHSVVVAKSARRQGEGKRLLNALFNRYSHKTWRVVAVCPARYQAFLTSLGFQRGELSQFHMRLELG